MLTRQVIRAFSGVEKPFLFSDLAVKAAESENKNKVFSTSEKAWISSRVNKFIGTAAGGISTSLPKMHAKLGFCQESRSSVD